MTTQPSHYTDRTTFNKRSVGADNERDRAHRAAMYQLSQGEPLASVLNFLRTRYLEIHNRALGLR